MLGNVFKVSMVWPPVCLAMFLRFRWFGPSMFCNVSKVSVVCYPFRFAYGLCSQYVLKVSMVCHPVCFAMFFKVSMVCPPSMLCNILKGSMVCAPVCLTIGLCHSIFCN